MSNDEPNITTDKVWEYRVVNNDGRFVTSGVIGGDFDFVKLQIVGIVALASLGGRSFVKTWRCVEGVYQGFSDSGVLLAWFWQVPLQPAIESEAPNMSDERVSESVYFADALSILKNEHSIHIIYHAGHWRVYIASGNNADAHTNHATFAQAFSEALGHINGQIDVLLGRLKDDYGIRLYPDPANGGWNALYSNNDGSRTVINHSTFDNAIATVLEHIKTLGGE
jgi:hypothetical protein